jgi:Kef-type K+ transport system membrane component KefB
LIERTFFAIAVIVLTARIVGLLFVKIHQPLVIGEIVGGIILGPTVVGAIVGNWLFPLSIRPSLNLVGQLALSLYMFMVGLRLRLAPVRSNPRMISAISVASVAVPFALAMPLAAVLYANHHLVGGHHVDRAAFFLFVGTSLSITAFPVLARILEERRMLGTELGAVATACAALQDLFGWCMLVVVLAIARSNGGLESFGRIALEGTACVAGIVVLSKVLGRLEGMFERPSGSLLLPITFVGILACAGSTQAIGMHAVFGAFLFGIVLRRCISAAACEQLREKLSPVTAGVLLPIYFITPGLSVNLRALSPSGAAEIVLILLAACAGKIGGAFVAGRSTGLSTRHAAIMGALMNTRGLIELIVLQVALSAGILDGRLFSELVFMAVFTTMIAAPLLALLLRPARGPEERALASMLALDPR